MKLALTITAGAAASALTIVTVAASGHTLSVSNAETLSVSAHVTSFHTVGKGPGAVTTFTDNLYVHGHKVGRDQVACIATGPGTFLECQGTDLLPKGQVESAGVFDPVHETHLTVGIEGGTGAYRDARGTIYVRLLSKTKSTYTYRFER